MSLMPASSSSSDVEPDLLSGRTHPHSWRWRGKHLAALAVILSIICGGQVAFGMAQDMSGTTAGNCTLSPVGIPLFGGTPAAVIAATPAAEVLGEAAQVDPATIQEAVSGIAECVNTGDPSYQYAIFTPRYLAAQFDDQAGHYQPAFEQLLDTPAVPATGRFELVSVEDLQGHPDGRVQVTLVLRSDQVTYRDTFLLAYVDDDWLIDEVVALDPVP